jgi:hypothetical protein
MSSVQIRQILEPKAPFARELVLSQNVCRVIRRIHPFTHCNPMRQGVNPV